MSTPDPFDLVFADLAARAFPPIRDEAGGVEIDLATMARLRSAQSALQELGAPELAEQDPRAVGEYLALLYVAYRYWAGGEITVDVPRERLQRLIDAPPDAAPPMPAAASYLRFPTHWFWAQIAEDQPHEPLAGLFVVGTSGAREVTVLAILGLRRDREGFSQIPLSVDRTGWEEASEIRRNPLFAPVMDGGSSAGFRSLASAGELVHLTHLALISGTE